MNSPRLQVIILTLYSEMFPGPLGISLTGKALHQGLWSLKTMNIRDFATDKHRTVDDTPYGGGAGMVMKPDIINAAIQAAKAELPDATLIYFTPRGTPLKQELIHNLLGNQQLTISNLILLCGRFEGVDERLLEEHAPLEISLGDFVLSGGEIAAMALLEACVRTIPGVVGAIESIEQESFAIGSDYAGLLEYPHYTKPPIWNGRAVPDVLMSGNHEKIRAWRLEQAKAITAARRPDLWDLHRTQLSKARDAKKG